MPLHHKAPGLRQCRGDGLGVQLLVGVSAPHSMPDSLLAESLASGRALGQQEPGFPTRVPSLASSSPFSPETSSSQSRPSCSPKLGHGSLPFFLFSPSPHPLPLSSRKHQPLCAALGARASSPHPHPPSPALGQSWSKDAWRLLFCSFS